MSFNSADLDRYITGNWGEDQFRGCDEPVCVVCDAPINEDGACACPQQEEAV